MSKTPSAKSKTKSPVTKKAAVKKVAPKASAKPKIAEDVHKFETGRAATAKAASKSAKKAPAKRRTTKKATADVDNLGELPTSYGENRIFVVAQEPRWLFCYWDYILTDHVKGDVFLRFGRQSTGKIEGEVTIPSESNSWYLSVREPDADYFVEIGHYVAGSKWKVLARSNIVLTPRDSVAAPGEPLFANMPFHVTFQQLVERLRGEMREGESLTEALARLQQQGHLELGNLSYSQRLALDSLLGTGLGSMTSGDLGRLMSSPLFSGGFSQSSWGAVPSSWPSGGEQKVAPKGFQELFGLLVSSWSGASWGAAASTTTAAGGASSWSSYGLAKRGESSWLSSWQSAPPRDFFMHVNAEVIFYGGTHPDARVTIDGKPITLRPDGSFRYHFVLPDGEFEIPIVATSPDGVETRRAILRFERDTARIGNVGATAQPPLPEPFGRKHLRNSFVAGEGI